MTTNNSASRLELLPRELFNYILGYIFDPVHCIIPESASQFRSYRFDTALLRVNKALHQLSRIYLHTSLSWIRFDINWHTFLIDPHWLGVSYITIDRPKSPKQLPPSYVSTQRRLTIQDAPTGCLHVQIVFPPATTLVQEKIGERCFNSETASNMHLLVLEADFRRFMKVLRMNDLAYCDRPTDNLPIQTPGDLGVSFHIRVTLGRDVARFEHLIHKFGVFSGPFHRYKISDAVVIRNTPYLVGPFGGEEARLKTCWEGISHLIYLKWMGDEYLWAKAYLSAYMCYDAALTLEYNWLAHDVRSKQERFWKFDEEISKAFGLSLAFNLAMAVVAGGLRTGKKRFRGHSMRQNMSIFLHTLRVTPHRTFLKIATIVALFEIFTEGVDLHVMKARLNSLIRSWRLVYGENYSPRSSTPMRKIYDSAMAILRDMEEHQRDSVDVTAHIESLRCVAQEAHFQPMIWVFREEMIPEQLMAQFMPSVTEVKTKVDGDCERTPNSMPSVPGPNQLGGDSFKNGEEERIFPI